LILCDTYQKKSSFISGAIFFGVIKFPVLFFWCYKISGAFFLVSKISRAIFFWCSPYHQRDMEVESDISSDSFLGIPSTSPMELEFLLSQDL